MTRTQADQGILRQAAHLKKRLALGFSARGYFSAKKARRLVRLSDELAWSKALFAMADA